jgi:hypothetical protein
MLDPGEQLKGVIAFKKQIEVEERYMITEYTNTTQFSKFLETHLAQWLRDHDDMKSLPQDSKFVTGETISSGAGLSVIAPDFNYWITEAVALLKVPFPDYANVLFCARKATETAKSRSEWAQAQNVTGIALFHLGKPDEAIATFSAIAETSAVSANQDLR